MNEKLVAADYRDIAGDFKTASSVSLEDVLVAKERRQAVRCRLQNTFGQVAVSLAVNYVGDVKSNFYTKIIFGEGYKSIINAVNTHFRVVNLSFSGEEGFFIVDGDAEKIKRTLVLTEESHPLGRFMDIDVYASDGRQISRESIGMPARKCMLCEKSARECYILRSHSPDELRAFIDAEVTRFLIKKYGD